MRALLVILAFLYALAFGIPTALYLAGYYGRTGATRGDAATGEPTVVTSVAPGSPAARAGIVAGDRLVRADAVRAAPFEQIYDITPAGRPIAFEVDHAGRRRTVELTPEPSHPSAGRTSLVIAMLARGALIALIGALLVLVRPSIMTAAFFILCLEFSELAHPFSNLELVDAAPLFWKPLFLLLTCIVNGGGPAVAAIFCMRFPSGEPRPSWRPAEIVMTAAGVFTIAIYFAALYAGGTATPLGSRLYGIFSIVVWLCYAVAAAAFMVRFVNAAGEDRARLRWVAIGLVSFVLSYALFWYAENDAHAPRDLSWWAQFINVLPFTVVYAIMRHRVLDVRIAGGRAIAFAVLSAIPVVAFSLIDWALSNQLQASRFALIAELCIAIGFGFWVNSSQRRIDNLIESVFFRARKVAEERLRRVARRLAHANAQSAVDEALVREPFEALRLASTALYLRAGGRYARVAQRGWAENAVPELDADDGLVLELVASGTSVDVGSIAWEGAAALADVRPSLAVPISARGSAIGFLLLGEKVDGERFDALEQSAVEALAGAAANAYDHLEGEEQRRLAAELRRTLDETMRENQTLRALLPREASGR